VNKADVFYIMRCNPRKPYQFEPTYSQQQNEKRIEVAAENNLRYAVFQGS
jgi:hypothetical protein